MTQEVVDIHLEHIFMSSMVTLLMNLYHVPQQAWGNGARRQTSLLVTILTKIGEIYSSIYSCIYQKHSLY